MPTQTLLLIQHHGGRSLNSLLDHELQVWVSNGSGAFLRRAPVKTAGGDQWVVSPRDTSAYLVRLVCPVAAANTARFQLLRSDLSLGQETGRNVRPVSFITDGQEPASPLALFAVDGQEDLDGAYTRVQGHEVVAFQVQGPARISVTSRLDFSTRQRPGADYAVAVHSASGTRSIEWEARKSLRLVQTGGSYVQVSVPQTEWFDVPSGTHQIGLKPDSDAFLRVAVESPAPFLLPRRNSPLLNGALVPLGRGIDRHTIDASEENLLSRDPSRLIRRVRDEAAGRGNEHQAMQALFNAEAVAVGHRGSAELPNVIRRLTQRYLDFETLRPVRPTANRERCRIAIPQLVGTAPDERPVYDQVVYLDKGDSKQWQASPSALFDQVDAEPMVYQWVQPAHAGKLRLLVEHASLQGTHQLSVQLDDQAPIQVQLDPHWQQWQQFIRWPTAVVQRHWNDLTLNDTRVASATYRRLVGVAAVELMVPHGTKQVMVRSQGGRSARVALQAMVKPSFKLEESAYLAALGQEASDWWKLHLLGDSTDAGSSDLAAHWYDLTQLVQSHRREYAERMTDVDDVIRVQHDVGKVPWAQLRKLHAESDWIELLEIACRYRHAPDAERRKLNSLIADALSELGEFYLLRQYLKRELAVADDTSARTHVLKLLGEHSSSVLPQREREVLDAATLSSDSTPRQLVSLARSMLDNGRNSMALSAILAVPEKDRDVEVVLRAALQLRWWSVFDDHLSQVRKPSRRRYWQGLRALANLQWDQAVDQLQQGDALSRSLAQHVIRGQKIRQGLISDERERRIRALIELERWQADHPGPYRWSLLRDALYSADETVVMKHAQREAFLTEAALVSSQRPVELVVQGPKRLRFRLRAVTDSPESADARDFAFVQSEYQRTVIPVTAVDWSTALYLPDRPELRVGLQAIGTLEIGPGRHRLQVTSRSSDMLVEVDTWEPVHRIPLLPALNPRLIDDVDRYRAHMAGTRNLALVDLAANRVTLKPFSGPDHIESVDPIQIRAPAALEARMALRTGTLDPRFAKALEQLPWSDADLTSHERMLALQRAGHAKTQSGRLLQRPDIPPRLRGEWYARQSEWDLAVRAESASGHAAAIRVMRMLEYLRTIDPQSPEWFVMASQLHQQFRQVPELAALYRRTNRRVGWQSLSEVRGGVGVRRMQLSGWEPESIAVRTRMALAGTAPKDEWLVRTDREMIFRFDIVRATRLRLQPRVISLPFLESQPMRWSWQLDDGVVRTVETSPGERGQEIQVSIPAGYHELRVRLVQPAANQYLVMRATEQGGAVADRIDEVGAIRTYYEATADAPLSVQVQGPAFVRIDEREKDSVRSRYQLFPAGRHTLSLAPDGQQASALYRVYTQVARPELPQVEESQPATPPAVQPPIAPEFDPEYRSNLWWQPQRSAFDNPLFGPMLDLIDQPTPWLSTTDLGLDRIGRDSTVMFSSGWVTRRALEEGGNTTRPDQFTSLEASHLVRHTPHSPYWKTTAGLRLRDGSGPTFLLRETFYHRFPDSGWRLVLDGGAWLQHPSGSIGQAAGEVEWAGRINMRAAHIKRLNERQVNALSVSTFGRILSLDQVRYRSGHIDQDVFTVFKSNHRHGLRISDTFTHRPWLDTKWWVRPMLFTNENYDVTRPDQAAIRFGWSQAVSGWEWDVSYRLARFVRDKDRSRSSTQQLLYLGARGDLFAGTGGRLEGWLDVQHDLGRGETTASVLFSWYIDRGRDNRDLQPGHWSFPELRTQR